ncbi:MAG: polyamine aminopropyltransferase [Desulfosarcinaceae bacterium]|nr:polyamine aminopropyltransferase [Desulfosarcinaceae bacterium]
MNKFSETLYDAWEQQLRIDELLYDSETEHQRLIIFRNATFGRVMALDGIVQTTERDEFIYHEMLAHVPILAHGNARQVLIIGGGDGGMLREVCRHRNVAEITQVEIDPRVVDMCRQYLPNHSAGAFDDGRLELVFADGLDYVRTTESRFDVIISDSTDPIGPGESLFSADFYAGCRRCLNPGGALVTQNGVVFIQMDEVVATARHLKRIFDDWHFYSAAVPTYVGGIMAFGWASDNADLRRQPLEVLTQRFAAAAINTRYYTPEVHQAAFALPRYMLAAINAPEE